MILKPPPGTTVHELHTATVWFGGDSIFCAVSKEGTQRRLEDISKTIEELKKLVPDEKMCMLIDVSHSTENTPEAREYASREFPKLFKAIAVVSGSALGRMVANLFVTIKSQPYPVRFFKGEAEARKWLGQFCNSVPLRQEDDSS